MTTTPVNGLTMAQQEASLKTLNVVLICGDTPGAFSVGPLASSQNPSTALTGDAHSTNVQQGPTTQALLSIMEPLGLSVSVFSEGTEAIQHIFNTLSTQALALPDLVITDLQAGALNGYQLCRLLKNDPATRTIPVLVLSAQDQMNAPELAGKMERFWSYKAGADAFLTYENTQALESAGFQKQLKERMTSLVTVYKRLTSLKSGKRTTSEKEAHLDAGYGNVPVLSRLNHILDRALIESTLMNDFRHLSELAHDAGLLTYMLFSLMETLVAYDVAMLLFCPPVSRALNVGDTRLMVHLPEGKCARQETLSDLKTQFFKRIQSELPQGQALGETLSMDVIGMTNESMDAEKIVSSHYEGSLVHVFRHDGQVIGAIALYNEAPVQYSQLFPVPLLLNELGLLMRMHALYEQAAIRAIVDTETGLYSYRHFIRLAEKEVQRANRYEIPLTLAVMDVDGLRQLNAFYGHQYGDDVLKSVSQMGQQVFRSVDLVGKSSREDIYVLFPETTPEAAEVAIQRLQEAVGEANWSKDGDTVTVSLSVGVAALQLETGTLHQLLESAETALHLAKEKGRNRIELYCNSD